MYVVFYLSHLISLPFEDLCGRSLSSEVFQGCFFGSFFFGKLLLAERKNPGEELGELVPDAQFRFKSPMRSEFELFLETLVLGEDSNCEGKSANDPGDDVHSECELASAKECGLNGKILTTAVDLPLLEQELAQKNKDEDRVVVESGEN